MGKESMVSVAMRCAILYNDPSSEGKHFHTEQGLAKGMKWQRVKVWRLE
ncbi:MAG TPA: hypothetical protein VMC44_00470 [Geobacteraceae bacterium]|nr:hypothetical protein [Geobacteraceae bacterium]